MMKQLQSLILLLAALMIPAAASADACLMKVDTEVGDVNSDSYVNISDVTSLIDHLLGNDVNVFNAANADTNRDGIINITDVTTLIDYLLNGTWPWDEPQVEHEWVDLGLPSGTLWATMNVSANAPEDNGGYFAWGETTTKEVYFWETYKWCNGNSDTLTKYCHDSRYGTVDNKMELDPEDDVAYVNWGPLWRMPSHDQQTELRTQCDWTWTTLNEVNGYLVTGPNGNTLFLPASGYYNGSSLRYEGNYGGYWSRTLNLVSPRYGHDLRFYPTYVYTGEYYRDYGFPVRPVRVSQD